MIASIRSRDSGRAEIEAPSPAAPQLQAKRGEPFVYRVRQKWRRRVLDLGFRESHPLTDCSEALEEGTIVRSAPDARFAGGYRLEETGYRARIYAYRATVARIIDGDTLWSTVDLGFGHWADIKLRLRGIDAEEIETAAGLRARDYLLNALSNSGDFVVTTTKVDLYDRYLADIFFLPENQELAVIARDGLFLNREMVRDGVARLWTKEKPPEF